MVVSAVLEGCLVISFGFVEFIGRARDTRQSSVDGFGDVKGDKQSYHP